jgi:thioesterase domain-containing protein
VALLALFDTYGPGYGVGAGKLSGWGRLHLHLSNLRWLEPDGRWSYVRSMLQWRWRQVAGIDPRGALPPELRRAEEALEEAVSRYEPRPYAGKVTLFRARYHPPGPADETLGWGKLAAGELKIYEVPGDHSTMMREPGVRVIAERLRACLEQGGPRWVCSNFL